MKIIAYSLANGTIACSDGTQTDSDWLNFLIKNKGEAIKVFDHLDNCVAKFLKHMYFHDEQLKSLHKTGRLYFQGVGYKYIPHKFFSIKYGGFGESEFTDMGQYDQELFNFVEPVDAPSRAKRASEIGQVVFDTLKSLKLEPRSLISPVNVWDDQVLSNCNLPDWEDLPDRVNLYANECCHGGWIESYKKGMFKETWDYDIVSAYPFYISQLADTRYGDWIESKEYQEKAYYGYCKGIVNITSKFSPIIHNKDVHESYTPIGEWETYLTKHEIDFIREYKLGTFEIESGWWWIPKKIVKPLESMVNSLFKEREKYQGLPKQIVKRILNGMWGKFGQIYTKDDTNLEMKLNLLNVQKDDEAFRKLWRYNRFGPHLNHSWYCEVESQSRLNVARFILDNNLVDSILSIAVDGVLSSRPVNCLLGDKMGDWKLNLNCPAIVISSSIIAVKDRESTGPFSLRYDWLLNEIKSNTKSSEYKLTKLSPVSLKKAVDQNRIKDLGKLEEITKTIDLTYEIKRCYKKEVGSGYDILKYVYDSEPWDISIIQNEVT